MTQTTSLTVGDVMRANPVQVDGLASVREAISLMRKHGINALVIDRRHDGDEYALVTIRDIAEKIIGPDRSCDRTSVYEIMTKPCLTVPAGMRIKYAIRLLTQFGLTRALVTEHDGASDKLAGIVTLRDMTLHYIDAEPVG